MQQWGYLISASIVGALMAQPVAAQTTDVNPQENAGPQENANPQENRASISNEIIVTAQRRAQSVMDVPLSIQALSGNQLADNGIQGLTSLQFTMPGYQADSNGGFVQVYLRGIGNAIFLGADPSVATFIDDVPQIFGNSSNNFIDVERVEVLKGAQGGLYGRNATGGVINIITRQPSTEDLAADVRVSFGERQTVQASAYVNIPISDRIAWNISASRSVHDPYLRNIAADVPYTAANFPTGSPFGTPEQTAAFFNASQRKPKLQTEDFWGVRSKLRLEPTDELTVTLSGSYVRKSDSEAASFLNLTPDYTQAVILGLMDQIGVTPDLPAGFLPDPKTRKWTNAIGGQANNYIRDYSFTGNVTWNGSNFDLTSITAYRNLHAINNVDAAQVGVPTVIIDVNLKRDFIYQELRAVSGFDGPISLIAGATYLDSNLGSTTDNFFFSRAIPVASTTVDQKVRNWSVYAEAGYDLTDRFNVTVSGRYMWEKNKADFGTAGGGVFETVQKKFVPSATVSYDLQDGRVYARWARGFKTGGVNVLNSPGFFPDPARDGGLFGPETVDTYEIGIKKPLLDRTLQVTAAVFYNNYKDLQAVAAARPLPEYAAIQVPVINAESARSYGAEVGINWQVAEALTLGVDVGYLNAKYKDFRLVGSPVLSDFDESGNPMPRAPKWQLSFNAALNQPISDDWRLKGNALVSHASRALFAYSGAAPFTDDIYAPSYWLVNARLGVATADDRFEVAAVADNLTDEVYYNGATANNLGNQVGLGKRRTIRGEFTFRY